MVTLLKVVVALDPCLSCERVVVPDTASTSVARGTQLSTKHIKNDGVVLIHCLQLLRLSPILKL